MRCDFYAVCYRKATRAVFWHFTIRREGTYENCSRRTRRTTCEQFRSLKEVLYGDDGPLHYRRRRSIRLLTSLAGLGTSYPHPHKRREVRPGASRMARRDSGEPGTVCTPF